MIHALVLASLAAATPLVLAVGVNAPAARDLAPLSFADDDAAAAVRLFGGAPQGSWLLTVPDAQTQEHDPAAAERARVPTVSGLRAAVKEAAAAAAAQRARGENPVVILWIVGHGVVPPGGEGAVALSDGLLTAAMLRNEVLAPLSAAAHRVHLVLDACHAAAMVKARASFSPEDAAEARADFASLDRTPFANVGVLLAAGEDQKTYEWDAVQGGVFSALVRSGLRGLADADLDGRVTYSEVAAFVASAVESIPNPRARPRMQARPPAVDAQAPLAVQAWFAGAQTMAVDGAAWGRFSVEDLRGRLIAAGNLEPGFTPTLVVSEPGPLVVRTAGRGQMLWRMDAGGEVLAAADDTGVTGRGPVEDALREGMFRVAFGPSYHRGYAAAPQAPRTEIVVVKPAHPMLRPLLVACAVTAGAAAIVPAALGVLGLLAALEGGYAFASTDLERRAWTGAARGAAGGSVAAVAAAGVAALVGTAVALAVLAVR